MHTRVHSGVQLYGRVSILRTQPRGRSFFSAFTVGSGHMQAVQKFHGARWCEI